MKSFTQGIRGLVGNFASDQKGAATSFSLLLIGTSLFLGGYAIDVSNVMTARTKLQIAADAAAHSALLTREMKTASEAKAAAVQVAELNMPVAIYGTVLAPADIIFGDYDHETTAFTPDSGSRQAVQVQTRRTNDNSNGVVTYLMKLVGLDNWDLVATSVFVTYHPTCLREGFVAEKRVDLQSNNIYSNGFCIHSNSEVSMNSNNYFEPGTVVSMSDLSDLELPNSGYESNDGLSDALREGSWNIRIIDRIEPLIDGLEFLDERYRPAYITNTVPVTLNNRNVYQDDLISGRLHTYTCGSGGSALKIKADVVMDSVVLVTDCKIQFESGVVLQDAVVATRSISAHAITSAAGLQLGKNDNCAIGGGAQLITMGSMDFPSDLQIYGGQLLALENISFAANANGIQGAAMVAGNEISGTSNMEMGFCGTGMENNFHAEYFKLIF